MTMILALALSAQEGIKVTTDRTVDSSSLESIVEGAIRLSGAKTNDEKAIAIHDYLHHTIFHCEYPTEKGQSVGPLKVINTYGWGLCGGQHTVLKSLFETAGWKVRYRGWEGHTTIEVQYDGRWHYFDTFLKCYFWTKDKSTIAGQDDIIRDPSIVLDALKEGRVPLDHYLCCGDDAEGIPEGCRTSKPYPPAKPEDGWASVTGRDRGYDTALNLPPGASLRLEWKAEPGQVAVKQRASHSCGNKDFRNDKTLGPILEHYGTRNHSNGRLTYVPDLSRPAGFELRGAEARGDKLAATSGQGAAIFKLPLPYVYVSSRIDASFEGEGKTCVSTDGGRTWQPAEDVSRAVKQKYDVAIKCEFSGALAKLRFEATVEHNRSALPYLLPGANNVTVSAAKLAPGRTITVTYAYQEATAPPGRKRWDGQGLSYSEPKTVTERASRVPRTFKVDVGGNTPPKMLYLELKGSE